ncbi:MAG TPA: thioredoxin family protein [Bacteroidales bacterium]|nr:thioredoxin family protein [Bacteroidales bacterium]
MEIRVLGSRCMKCNNMEKVVRKTVEHNNITAQVSKVEDIMEIISYGVMTTPALVVDGKVVIKGRVPTKDEVLKVLTQ